ncbi:hypothetical protein Q5M85_03300 [Paraclostridium bifermentans]|nr:hypothetical protein [Paraclostridium bifermentans]
MIGTEIGIRAILGLLFIAYGLIVSGIEKYKGLPFFYSKDQINGSINGFICLSVGYYYYGLIQNKVYFVLLLLLLYTL